MKVQKRNIVKENYTIRLPAHIRSRLVHLQDEKEFKVSHWVRDVICTAVANLSLTASDPNGSGWVPDSEAASFADLHAPRNSEAWRWSYAGYLGGRNGSKK